MTFVILCTLVFAFAAFLAIAYARGRALRVSEEIEYQAPERPFQPPIDDGLQSTLAGIMNTPEQKFMTFVRGINAGSISPDQITRADIDTIFERVVGPHPDGQALAALAYLRDPRALEIRHHIQKDLLSGLEDENLNNEERITYKMGLASIFADLEIFGTPVVLPRLTQVAVAYPKLAGPSIQAIEAILNRSAAECSSDQLRAILSLPDRVTYTLTVQKSEADSDRWSEYAEEDRLIDCNDIKAKASSQLRRQSY